MKNGNELPVVIIGAGPVGLAAAAHLAKRRISFILFEAGDDIGSAVSTWEHIRVFSPWKFNIDSAADELLRLSGWTPPNGEELPTGREFIDRYLKPLSKTPRLRDSIFTGSRVIAVGKRGMDKLKDKDRESLPFEIRVQQGHRVIRVEARAVIDTSGTWASPNPIGSGGMPAMGETENSSHIFYGIPDILSLYRDRYAGKSVAVVGSGHSAVNAILDLEKLKREAGQTEISWIMRKQNISDVFGGMENDALKARGELGSRIESLVNEDRISIYTPFEIDAIKKTGNQLSLTGRQHGRLAQIPHIDEIIAVTGSRPDLSFLREIRLNISPSLESVAALAELIDPNIHSCGTVRPHGEKELRHPEVNFYIAGSKSYGRAPTFLMATGYEQVRSIAAALDGDMEAARSVQLYLPATGVCSSGASGSSCCVPGKQKAVACCG